MIRRTPTLVLASACALVLLSGCGREGNAPATVAPDPGAGQPAAAAAPMALQDVIETRPEYIVGISYPQEIGKHPILARALQAYAEAARADLMQAVAGLQGRKPTATMAPSPRRHPPGPASWSGVGPWEWPQCSS